MRRFAAAAVCLLFLSLAGGASGTITPARGMWGLTLGMTPAQVQARLGRPLKSGPRWYYLNVTVTFRARRVVELTTAKKADRLSNGLGINSSETQLRRAFPKIRCATWRILARRCRLGTEAPGSRVTDFLLSRGRVFQITITQLP